MIGRDNGSSKKLKDEVAAVVVVVVESRSRWEEKEGPFEIWSRSNLTVFCSCFRLCGLELIVPEHNCVTMMPVTSDTSSDERLRYTDRQLEEGMLMLCLLMQADDFNGVTVQSQSLAQREDESLLSPPPPAVSEVGVNGSSSQDTEEEKTTEAPSTLVASLSDHATSFWDLLRAVAQQQLEEKDAEAFCDTFKLLHEEL
ncbi:unnamed protein product, partial [Sphagnum compactum]